MRAPHKSKLYVRMIGKTNLTLLVGIGILFLAGIIVTQALQVGGSFSIVRSRIDVKEPFEDGKGGASEPVLGVLEMAATGPADANVANQRQPYNLLNGVLPEDDRNRLSTLSAQTCYEADFENRLQRSSHRQLTNNYKRLNPDSCSAPFHELVTSFYKVEPLLAA